MSSPGAAAAPSPVPARADRQRERILRAARACFVRHGFHAAAMADIAAAAGMSAGLIYRYFPSKSAIVHAIIGQQMEEARRALDAIGSAADLVTGIVEAFERWSQPGEDGKMRADEMSPGLILEMVALAARDPEVAATMRAADAALRASLAEALRRGLGAEANPGAPAAFRVVTLQCLIEGLLVRAIRQPDLDRGDLRACLEAALAGTLGGVCAAANGRDDGRAKRD